MILAWHASDTWCFAVAVTRAASAVAAAAAAAAAAVALMHAQR